RRCAVLTSPFLQHARNQGWFRSLQGGGIVEFRGFLKLPAGVCPASGFERRQGQKQAALHATWCPLDTYGQQRNCAHRIATVDQLLTSAGEVLFLARGFSSRTLRGILPEPRRQRAHQPCHGKLVRILSQFPQNNVDATCFVGGPELDRLMCC